MPTRSPTSEFLYSSGDVRPRYSDEIGTSYSDGAQGFSRIGPRIDSATPPRGSSVRVARIETKESTQACMGGKYRLSDRIRVSCAVRDKTGPGVIDLEIRNSDGLCARTLFRAQFAYQLPQTDEREWLVTLQGDPCEEYEVHVSYVDNTPVPAALPPQCEVMLGVIVDRGSPPGGASPRGAGEVSIQVNTDLLVQQIFPVPSRYLAVELAAPVGGYAIAPSIDLTGVQGWTPDQLSLAISSTGAADEVWVSFDGVNDEIHMVAGTSTSSFTMPSRARQVWIRTPAGVVTVQSIVTRTRAV